jgi:RIO-like serine/threonine protein kinase
MDCHQCTTNRLWNIITRSNNRVELTKYWIEETLKGILHLNKAGFIHCNLNMNNIVVDYNGNIRVYNFDQCLHRDECAVRVGRGAWKL